MEHALYEQVYQLQQSHWWFMARRQYVTALLHRYAIAGPVLDVGCGSGSMLSFLTRYGRVTGLDPYRPALKMAGRLFNGPLVQGGIEQLPFRGHQFHLVTAFEVLYHRGVQDVTRAIRELCRVLVPGGYLIVADSAYKALASGHDRVSHAARRFSRRELKCHLEAAGLEIETATYAYAAVLPVVFLFRKLQTLIKPSDEPTADLTAVHPWINRALIRWLAFEARLTRLGPCPFGLSVQLVGKKPAAAI